MYTLVKSNPHQCKPTDWKKNMMADVLIDSASSKLSDEEVAPSCKLPLVKPPTMTSVLGHHYQLGCGFCLKPATQKEGSGFRKEARKRERSGPQGSVKLASR